jgi:adenylosuccinate synthase
VVTGYRLTDGSIVTTFPADAEIAESVTPISEELPGWTAPTEGVVREDELPGAAEAYIAFLEEKLGIPIVIVSTGPRREETLVRGDSDLAKRLRGILARNP